MKITETSPRTIFTLSQNFTCFTTLLIMNHNILVIYEHQKLKNIGYINHCLIKHQKKNPVKKELETTLFCGKIKQKKIL